MTSSSLELLAYSKEAGLVEMLSLTPSFDKPDNGECIVRFIEQWIHEQD
jgi:dihydrodipicolinate synthase/N-acetylneuraminate lyase